MDQPPYLRHALRVARNASVIVIYDTETTGLDQLESPMPLIWELGAVRRPARGKRQPHSAILNCGVEIPWGANLRHIDPRTPLMRGRPSAQVLTGFRRFVAGAILAGHNIVDFDNPLLAHAYALAELAAPPQLTDKRQCIDTVLLARALWPKGASDGPPDNKLITLARFLEVPFETASLHGALADVILNEMVLDRLLALTAVRLGAPPISIPFDPQAMR